MITIIAAHTSAFDPQGSSNNETYWALGTAVNQVARFTMPFFFAISGYFFGVNVRCGGNAVCLAHSRAKRIGLVFLSWCLLYLLPYNLAAIYEFGALGPIKVAYWNILELSQDPVLLLMQGTKGHLWFLVAMICAVYISAVFIQRGMIKSLLAIAALFYVVGVLAKAYANTPIGLGLEFNTRNGPFFSLLPFASGYCISGLKVDARWLWYGAILFSLGLAVHFVEVYVLWRYYETSPRQDYVFASYLAGMGVAISSLSQHKLLQRDALSKIGRLSLGIYVVHIVFVDNLRVIDSIIHSALWDIVYIFLVLGLSVASVLLSAKNRYAKHIVI